MLSILKVKNGRVAVVKTGFHTYLEAIKSPFYVKGYMIGRQC